MIYSTFETKSHFGRYIRPKRSNLILRLAHGPLTGLVAKQAKCQHLPTSLLVLLKLLFNLHAARKRYSKKGHYYIVLLVLCGNSESVTFSSYFPEDDSEFETELGMSRHLYHHLVIYFTCGTCFTYTDKNKTAEHHCENTIVHA